jgi:hypothetical protein
MMMALPNKEEMLLILVTILTVKKNLMMIHALCKSKFRKVKMLQAVNPKENLKLKMMAAS